MEVKTETSTASRLMSLFEGFRAAFGTYDSASASDMRGGKLEIKQTARTVRRDVTRQLFEAHLSGDQPLGIIPIREDDTCLWGAIDIDVYSGLDHADLVKVIAEARLPMIVCRSKSGGAHVFIFMLDPVSAELMQTALGEIAALLGYGGHEIFPKQKHIASERGDIGNWLNLPYFAAGPDGDQSPRSAIKEGGLEMTLSEFVSLAERSRVAPTYLRNAQYNDHAVAKESLSEGKIRHHPDFGDGPPCLQHLSVHGFPEGTRNNGLFNLGTFAKKKYGSEWQSKLETWNHELMDPPLPSTEIVSIVRQQDKKDYQYQCKLSPLSSHCNSTKCRTRRFGVGGADEYPHVRGMTYIDAIPKLWFMDVGSERLELTTDQLQNYKMFHRECMEQLNVCFQMMKQNDWMAIVSDLMRNAIRLDAPDEVSHQGQFEELLEDFLTNKYRGETAEALLSGKPYEDQKEQRYYFRLKDLRSHLENRNFKVYSTAQLADRIRRLGGESRFVKVKERNISAWWIPNVYEPMPQATLPTGGGDPI